MIIRFTIRSMQGNTQSFHLVLLHLIRNFMDRACGPTHAAHAAAQVNVDTCFLSSTCPETTKPNRVQVPQLHCSSQLNVCCVIRGKWTLAYWQRRIIDVHLNLIIAQVSGWVEPRGRALTRLERSTMHAWRHSQLRQSIPQVHEFKDFGKKNAIPGLRCGVYLVPRAMLKCPHPISSRMGHRDAWKLYYRIRSVNDWGAWCEDCKK
jgi:hypothetical protein